MQTNDPSSMQRAARSCVRTVAGVVFLLVLLAGLVSAVWAVAQGHVSLGSKSWDRAAFFDGEAGRKLAGELAQSPMPTFMADAERAASWLVAGSLGPRVRQGCDNWLFLVDELEVHPDASASATKRLDAVARVRDLLQARHVDLLVVTVPDKSRIQYAQLCNIYRPSILAGRVADWERGLAQRGVRSVSVTAALEALARDGSESPFLRADTHWSEQGAGKAADLVADSIRRTGINLTPVQHYRLQRTEPAPRQGDLVRLAGLGWLPAGLQPKSDHVATTLFTLETPPAPAAADSAHDDSDLFGDANLPSLALLGTSYSRTSSFVPFLQAALNTQIPSFAQDGGDFFGAAKTYLAGKELREAPPKLVIWEIPERVIQMPMSPDEVRWIESLKSPAVAR